MSVFGVVLAAGSSNRLGRPKQLLPVGDETLLDRTLRTVRACGLDGIVVALGGAASEVVSVVDLSGCRVVENRHHTTGCSSTIASALGAIPADANGIVLFLGDQPFVEPLVVRRLVEEAGAADTGVCLYDNGRGHPLWFNASMFPALSSLHGDKAVWKLLDSADVQVVEVRAGGPIPLDVDTWDDFEALLAVEREQ